jgi:hypothetical protein
LVLSDGSRIDGNGDQAMLVIDGEGTVQQARCFPTRVSSPMAADGQGGVAVVTSGLADGTLMRLPP